jgi:Xaa-Pro aminopeptidase
MRRDLDGLMKDRGIDALTVSGSPARSRDLFYLTGPVAVTGARLFKKRGRAPVLVVSGMEREEAARSGLEVKTGHDFGLLEVAQKAGNPLEASVNGFLRICEALDVKGTVSFYGTGDIAFAHSFLSEIEQKGGIDVRTEPYDSILSEARMTKDDDEIGRIDSVSRRAQEVMAAVRDFLSSCSEKGGAVADLEGRPVTIGRVKQMIKKGTEERGMMLEEPVIFSEGRDSAVPHSRGDDEAALVPGKTIVFDYCPQEAGGGYFCDITRTWCLGHVPAEVEEIYGQVREIHEKLLERLKVGELCSSYDRYTNEYFDGHGHPTPMKGTASSEGYVHSLGHGIGLDIHERPRLSVLSKSEVRLAPGHVFTVEPGLYYPEREIGVRIEDDIAIREDGTITNLTTLAKDILIPLR